MSIFDIPDSPGIARHFRRALLDCDRSETPYLHWKLADVLPEALCLGIISLPIAPLLIDDCGGVRDLDNNLRSFVTPSMRQRFPLWQRFAEALQRPDVARLLGKTCEFEVEGSFLRMEYIQDIDGAWLEPHRDIPEKLFSMVIYLFTGPEAAGWGTDIYDADRKWVGRSPGDFNAGTIFVAGPATWHGFEPRPIIGVRRLMEINYARADWRDREQLADPERPIRLA